MKRLSAIFVTLTLCAFALLPAYAQSAKPIVAVADFSGIGISSAELAALRSHFEVELFKTGAYDMVERAQAETILKEQEYQLSGCVDDKCIIEIGKQLGAQYIFMGSASKLGSNIQIIVKMVGIRLGKLEKAETVSGKNVDELLAALPGAAMKLAGRKDLAGGSGGIVWDSGSASSAAGAGTSGSASAERAYVQFESTPSGMSLVIKDSLGKVIGSYETPKSLPLGKGSYTIEAEDPAGMYYTYKGSLDFSKPAKARFPITMAPRFGTVSISSEPSGARVSLNGIDIGTTPITGRQLKSGNYDITLSLELYAGKRVSLVVSDGKAASVNEKLASNFITLDAREKNGLPAEVWVDGKKLGDAPFSGRIAFRDFSLSIRPKDSRYKPYEETVIVRSAGESLSRPVALEGRTGTLLVETEPSTEADVWLDGKRLGTAPDMFTVLAGEHELRVSATLNGQKVEASNKVTVTEGREAMAKVTLHGPAAAYKIGDRGPAGGFVFYDKGTESEGWRYLEAAPNDQSGGIQWYNGSYLDIKGDTAIGAGRANTSAIIAAQGKGSYAAQLCADLVLGGFDDWFLPSRDELDLMYKNLKMAGGLGGSWSDWYWSSSQSSTVGYAWHQVFSVGFQSYSNEYRTYAVRAVRAFTTGDKHGLATAGSIITNSVGIKLVSIQGGSFAMGSPTSDKYRSRSETQHQVSVSAFWMGQYEVTQAQWQAVMGNDPSYFKGDRLPVEQVSWYDAIVYCNKLSIKEGLAPCYGISGSSDPDRWGSVPTSSDAAWDKAVCNVYATGYRLPTEAEWEYACRAGTSTGTSYGDSLSSAQANFCGDYPYGEAPKGPNLLKTTPVGSYTPNAWGLYDMHGNVNEWCTDWYGTYASGSQSDPLGASSGDHRVLRGGSWNNIGNYTRSADRSFYYSYGYSNAYGFRLVRRPSPLESVVPTISAASQSSIPSSSSALSFPIGSRGPAGGIVFYDKGSYSDGWRYLEAAPIDTQANIQWYNGYYMSIKTDTAIGAGKTNTASIISALGVGTYAASVCDKLVLGIYDDWFLPSKDELNLMYTNLRKVGLGGFEGLWFCSSSKDDSRSAWLQNFSNGEQSCESGTGTVRACRAF